MTCRELVPIVHGLEREYGDRIFFDRVNIHDRQTLPLQARLGFSTTPEFYLLNEEDRVLGAWDESVTVEQLRQAFDRLLGP